MTDLRSAFLGCTGGQKGSSLGFRLSARTYSWFEFDRALYRAPKRVLGASAFRFISQRCM